MLAPDSILQNRYLIVRQLAKGGMGTVYEAVDQRLDATVALKETSFEEEALRKQFEREARLLARLLHPALPRVSDHFSEGGGQFLVMQFIPGEDLEEMRKRSGGRFGLRDVLAWADQLLDALDYLHTQEPPVVHRDIKPQNIKLTSRGQIILLDFGLAKGFAGQVSRVSTSGSIFGYTPNYAPLEQIQGTGTDPRSDLYSLGATLYHLLTGITPFDVLTRLTAITNGEDDPLRAAHDATPHVPLSVSSVLAKVMSIGRNQRFSTAAEMRQALNKTAEVHTRGRAEELPSTITGESSAAPAPPKAPHPARQAAKDVEETVIAQRGRASLGSNPGASPWECERCGKVNRRDRVHCWHCAMPMS